MTPTAQPVTSDAVPATLPWDDVAFCEAVGREAPGFVYCWQREGHEGPHFDEAFGWWRVKEEGE